MSIILIVFWGVPNHFDTDSYFNAWTNLKQGKIDIFRTPTYPIFIGLIQGLSGASLFKLAIVIAQYILFFVSIFFFYKITCHFIDNSKVCSFITLFYAICPGIISWNNLILTEPLAISGTVFLLYYSIRLYEKPMVKMALLYAFWLLFLIFLRPSFLYLFPALLFFWALSGLYGKARVFLLGILCTVFVLCCEAFYICKFEKSYGVYSPSSVGVLNQYYIVRQHGLINVDGISNDSLRCELQRSIESNGATTNNHDLLWTEGYDFISRYGLKEVQTVISTTMKEHPVEMLKKALGRSIRAMHTPLFHSLIPVSGIVYYFVDFTGFDFTDFLSMGLLYVFIIIYVIILIRNTLYKKRKMPCLSMLLLLIGVGNLITVIIGAQESWNRLIVPSMPIYLLMFGQICTMFKVKSPLSIDFK